MIPPSVVKRIDAHLAKYGLRKTWLLMLAELATSKGASFRYILADPTFAKIKAGDENVLGGLTVGEVSILYEYSLAKVNHTSRKKEGQYFTPDDVAVFIASQSAKFPKTGTWLDPCCGVGNLSFWLAKKQPNPENFIKDRLILVDLDDLALLIARVLFTLAFQKNDLKMFNNLKKNFIQLDFLATEKLPAFDFAILNPPYVTAKADSRFVSSQTKNTFAYFLERVVKNSQGFISITPQTFTNSDKYSSIRELLINKFDFLNIYCFDNVPDNIFKGFKYGSTNSNTANSVRAAVIVAVADGKKQHQITPLLRWRSHERAQMFENIEQFLTPVTFSTRVFPKVRREVAALLESAVGYKVRMFNLVSSRPTKHRLIIPSTPRYFISALKTPVLRTSAKILYFYNQRELDQAYLLLNSSFAYLWWRTYDGGMTLSEKTLLTIPVPPNMKDSPGLIKKLELSEKNNKVIKKNAGLQIENVKHDKHTIALLNAHIFPKYATYLLRLHQNSDL